MSAMMLQMLARHSTHAKHAPATPPAAPAATASLLSPSAASPAAAASPAPAAPAQQHAIVNSYALAFLKSYLRSSDEAGTETCPAIIEPLESRQPRRSRGALLHDRGQCRPCAWYWKPQGCHLGEECCHCHMCSKGELKARKKSKMAAIRAKEAEEASR